MHMAMIFSSPSVLMRADCPSEEAVCLKAVTSEPKLMTTVVVALLMG